MKKTNESATRFTVDFFEKKIFGTKASFNKASKGTGDAYKELTRLMNAHPDFKLVEKEQKKRRQREQPYDSIMPPKPLAIKFGVPSQMDPDRVVTIESPSPLERFDTAAVHLYSKIDTLWYRAPFELYPVEGRLRQFELVAEWHPDTEYSLEIDSAAFVDIYGLASKPYKQGLKVRSLDDYATLAVRLSGITDTATVVVELLSKSDAPVKRVKVEQGVAEFFYVSPGTYYLRAFVDSNDNGEWDTGDYAADRQPEAVYYYPREVECKAKWDVTQQWNVNERPRDHQKPAAITKQKPDKEKQRLRNRNADRARQLGIEYVVK